MSGNVVNQVAYLKTSRNFPEDSKQLTTEVNKTYVDIASAVNSRTIGIFPATRPAINGEEWFIFGNRKQQGFRQVYPFTGPNLAITILHGINVPEISQFTRIYGTFTDGDFSYPIPYVSIVTPNNQVQLFVGQTKIFINSGGGAPTIDSGTIVLEWIAQP
jgi:hypothetical protein